MASELKKVGSIRISTFRAEVSPSQEKTRLIHRARRENYHCSQILFKMFKMFKMFEFHHFDLFFCNSECRRNILTTRGLLRLWIEVCLQCNVLGWAQLDRELNIPPRRE